MAYFLIQASYKPESWANQIADPRSVEDRIRPAIQELGGRLDSTYYAFGEADVVAIAEFPSNDAAGAFSVMVTAAGAMKSVKTTPLMTVNEGIEMMKKAGQVAGKYKAPTSAQKVSAN
ncbi:MAG TPA: GYD domain-containing protein [Candidatus Dormibacteraeota bacterium]